ncbi:MAG: FIST N-terminal domain-containing protein [Alphaproteobacteria bacterium]|nr:FIST N-terminal domain-containing protein [Alphaproteobacteria bacterium]MDP6565834.1 FIST N-terminal domain-containing protein [Alphaproteobacteria bacterium]MDP6813089.1 FIST N-terminal domain-containing protein [Alphaproteobacteria bacterium]
MLEFSSGSSNAVNSKTAIRECIDNALGEGQGGDCQLLVVHATMGHNFKQLLAAAREACADATVIGCTGSGVISSEGVSENMRALAVMAVRGDELAVAFADGLDGNNSYDLGKDAAQSLQAAQPGINMIYILTAGLDVSGDRVIDGIEDVFGPEVPIFGATAADNGKAKGSFQFFNDAVTEQGVVLVGFADPTLELEIGVHHGSIPLEGVTFEVTKTQDNQILELDGEPAWPRLMARLGLDASTPVADALPITGLGIELSPEDQEAYDNPHILRVPIKVSEDRQSFYLPATVPEGTRVSLMQRDEGYIFEGVDRMMARLDEQMNGRRPVAVFHADCMARGRHMFNKVLKDEIIAKMQHPLCGDEVAPWLGVYGYSEYCRFGGKNRFHSYTTSLFPLVRRDAA